MSISLATFRSMNDLYTNDDAIDLAAARGLKINKHADPVEPARLDLDTDDAKEVAAEDAGLLTVEAPEVVLGAAWDAAQAVGPEDFQAMITGTTIGVMWTTYGRATVVRDDGQGRADAVSGASYDDVFDAIAHAERLAR